MDYEQYLYGKTATEADRSERGSAFSSDILAIGAILGAAAAGLAAGVWIALGVISGDGPSNGPAPASLSQEHGAQTVAPQR